jgi:hypothetical protein
MILLFLRAGDGRLIRSLFDPAAQTHLAEMDYATEKWVFAGGRFGGKDLLKTNEINNLGY